MYGELPIIKTSDGQEVPGFPVSIQNPPKMCVLRLPTSEQIMTYMRAQKSVYRDLGRGQGEGEDLPTPQADQKLFNAIRIDKDGDEFDDAEALYAISQILLHRVVKTERDGQQYEVTLKTLFGDTTHTIEIPFQKDMAEYRRGIYKSRDVGRNVEERRFPPEVPVKLYDKFVRSSEGYAKNEPVPPHHKRSVVAAVVSALVELDPFIDPN
jgi:hypothetical protein